LHMLKKAIKERRYLKLVGEYMATYSLEKRRWAIRKKLQGWSVSKICAHGKIKRRTFYEWWSRYQKYGWDGLTYKSRAPRNPKRTPDQVKSMILTLRSQYGWNKRKIKVILEERGINISESTIYRILRAAGMVNTHHKPYRRHKYIRWERSRPNELWQMDIKEIERGNLYLIAIIDDYSRFVVNARFTRRATEEAVIYVLDEAIRMHGVPENILTDNGVQFGLKGDRDSMFDTYCELKGIRHIRTGVGKPTTTGKIERWFGTFDREAWRYRDLDEFLYVYNWVRPHQSLDYRRPGEVYFGYDWIKESLVGENKGESR